MTTDHLITKSPTIHAPAAKVWAALTDPQQMKIWMAQPEMEIITDWKVGSTILMHGPWYKSRFENRGKILLFEPCFALQYTHLSSLSRLPDTDANHTLLDFRLAIEGEQTTLTLTMSNFPTETIEKHLAYYWNVTLTILKKFVEEQQA